LNVHSDTAEEAEEEQPAIEDMENLSEDKNRVAEVAI
jgi:hypothetical protein